MRVRLGLLERCGALMFGGYLLFFLLRHDPYPRAVPGILAIAPPGYLRAAAQINLLQLPPARLGIPAASFASAGLLIVLVLLFVAYFRALHFARKQASQNGGLAIILIGLLLFSLPLILCPYLLSRDIYSYIFYGRIAALYGGNPAISPPAAYPHDPFFGYLVSWKDVPSVYGPVWALLSHALTLAVERLGGELWLYLLIYKLVALAAHIANTVLIWRIVLAWRPGQQLFGALLYAWNPVALIEFAGSAHNDVLMISMILLAIVCTQRGYWRVAVVALVVAALIKWIAIVLLPLWVVFWLRREPTWLSRLWCAGQVAAIAVASALVLYIPYGQLARSIAAPLALQSAMKAENSLGALAIRGGQEALLRLGMQSASAPAWRAAAEQVVAWSSKGLVLLAWLLGLCAVWRQPSFERLLRVCFWLLLALLLISPLFRVWYVTWPLALAALLDSRPAWRIIGTFAVAAPLVQLQSESPAWLDALVFVPVIALIIYELWQACLHYRLRMRTLQAQHSVARSSS